MRRTRFIRPAIIPSRALSRLHTCSRKCDRAERARPNTERAMDLKLTTARFAATVWRARCRCQRTPYLEKPAPETTLRGKTEDATMAIKEYSPGSTFPGVVGRTVEASQP